MIIFAYKKKLSKKILIFEQQINNFGGRICFICSFILMSLPGLRSLQKPFKIKRHAHKSQTKTEKDI